VDADYHVHSTYSDGSQLPVMVAAAEAAGLDAVGVADHCVVSERESKRAARAREGATFDLTYERRREALAAVRADAGVEVYDAVEMDYHPADEPAIRGFLDDAGFAYAVGSVHEVRGANVHDRDHFAALPLAEREAAVAEYVERLVALVDSGLFEVAAHPDLVERNPALRGFATDDQYRRIAEAFADSRTVPEVNAGRVLGDYGELHPRPEFLDVLAEYDVAVTVGTDSHDPGEIAPRVAEIEAMLDERGLEPVAVV
jgi:histidinol-phosphatase (PHP family)